MSWENTRELEEQRGEKKGPSRQNSMSKDVEESWDRWRENRECSRVSRIGWLGWMNGRDGWKGWSHVMDSPELRCPCGALIAAEIIEGRPPPAPAVHSRTQELPRDCRSGFSLFFEASPIDLKTQAQGSQYLVGAMKNFRDVLGIFYSCQRMVLHPSPAPQKQVKSKGMVLLESKQCSVCLNYILDVPGNLEPWSSVGVWLCELFL